MRTGFFSHLPECAPVVRMALMCAFAAAAIVLPQQGEATDKVVLNSSAFEPDGPIPAKFTCEGEDVSPALTWSGVPSGTKSLALIVDDPDAPDPAAPKMTWVHWVLYDVPPSAQGLPEAAGVNSLPHGTREGLNDWRRTVTLSPRNRHPFGGSILRTGVQNGKATSKEIHGRVQGRNREVDLRERENGGFRSEGTRFDGNRCPQLGEDG